MELYNVRDPPGRRDRKIYRENTIATKTIIVSKFKRNIHEDHFPRILPRKVFFAQSLSSLTFLLSLIHCTYCLIHWSLAFKSTFYRFIVLGSLGLNPFIFWALEPKPALTIYIYIYIYKWLIIVRGT